MSLVTKDLLSLSSLIGINQSNCLMTVNVYMPCSGTLNRHLIYSDIIHEIQSLFSAYPDCNYLIGGDFNVCLDSSESRWRHCQEFLVT